MFLGLEYNGRHKSGWSKLRAINKAEQNAHESARFFRLLLKAEYAPDPTTLNGEIADFERTGTTITCVTFTDATALSKFTFALPSFTGHKILGFQGGVARGGVSPVLPLSSF